MAKLDLKDLTPLENTKGKYLEVMGVTATQVVLIGAGGKTSSVPLVELPEAKSGDLIYINESNEITGKEQLEKAIKKAADSNGSQQNGRKGSNRVELRPNQSA